MPKPRQRKSPDSDQTRNNVQAEAPLFELLEPRVLYSADALGVSAVFLPDDTDRGNEHYVDSNALVSPLTGYAHIPANELIDEHQYAAEDTALDAAHADTQPIELIFIDSRVPDSRAFIDAWADTNARFVVIDADDSAIDVITDNLQRISDGGANVSTIKIVSHGASGLLQLGADDVTESFLIEHSSSLNLWSSSLTHDADILLFGCNVGDGAQGLSFVQTLGELTGTDVAASDDETGNKTAGGDWTLEVSYGVTTSFDAALNPALADWTHTLAIIEVSYLEDDIVGYDADTITVTELENYANVSLRMAIAAANNSAGDDTIHLTNSSNEYVIGNSAIAVNKNGGGNLTIENQSSGNVDISQAPQLAQSGFFIVDYGVFTIDGAPVDHVNPDAVIKFSDATSDNHGGVIHGKTQTVVNVRDVHFVNNQTVSNSFNGGAIYTAGQLDVEDSVFKDNVGSDGGAIYVASGAQFDIANSIFENNSAAGTDSDHGHGGALFTEANGSTHQVSFLDNSANRNGGAIFQTTSSLSINESEFGSNTAELGGAIYTTNTTNLEVYNSTLYNHMEGGTIKSGAKLFVTDTFFVNDWNVVDNGLTVNASAIIGFEVEVIRSSFIGHYYSNLGGAILADTLTIRASEFYDNTANIGGGAVAALTNLTVESSHFEGNKTHTNSETTGYGGAIFSTAYDSSVATSSFVNNTAFRGSAYFSQSLDPSTIDRTTSIYRVTFSDNTALDNGTVVGGGGVEVNVTSSTFANNTADNVSGSAGFSASAITADSTSIASVGSSIFVDNNVTNGAGQNLSLGVTSTGHNLFDNFESAQNVALGDTVDTSITLGILTGVPGSVVQVRPLTTGSSAIDGSVGLETTDAQNLPIHGIPDIGASEYQIATETIYWADEYGDIYSSDGEFSNDTLLFHTGGHDVQEIYVDLDGPGANGDSRIYWTNATDGGIYYTSLDGSGEHFKTITAVSGTVDPNNGQPIVLTPNSIAMDVDRDLVFLLHGHVPFHPPAIRVWQLTDLDSEYVGQIENPDPSGSYVMQNPRDIYYSAATGRIYWVDGVSTAEAAADSKLSTAVASIHSSLADGSDYQLEYASNSVEDSYQGITLNEHGQFLYFSNSNTQTVQRLELSTGAMLESAPVSTLGTDPQSGIGDVAYLSNGDQIVVSNAIDNTLTLFNADLSSVDETHLHSSVPVAVEVASTRDASEASFSIGNFTLPEATTAKIIDNTHLSIDIPAGTTGNNLDFVLVSLPSDGGVLQDASGNVLSVGDSFKVSDQITYVNADPGTTTIDTFQLELTDGTYTTPIKTFYVNIEQAYVPEFTINDVNVIENSLPQTLDVNDFIFVDENNVLPHSYALTVDTVPVGLVILVNGTQATTFTHTQLVNGLVEVSAQDVDIDGTNPNIDVPAIFTVEAFDAGGNLIISEDPSNASGSTTLTFNIEPVDDPSVLHAVSTITMDEGSSEALIDVGGLVFEDEESNEPVFYSVTSLPDPNLYTVTVNGTVMNSPGTFDQVDLVSGDVKIVATNNVTQPSVTTTSLTLVAVTDAANPASNSNPVTLTLNVEPVDDKPVASGSSITGITLNENNVLQLNAGHFDYSDEENDPIDSFEIVAISETGENTSIEGVIVSNNGVEMAPGDRFTLSDLDSGLITINAVNADLDADTQLTLVLTAQSVNPSGLVSDEFDFIVNIIEQNDPPTLSLVNFATDEGTLTPISLADLGFNDEETPNTATYSFSGKGDLGGASIIVDGISQGTSGSFTHQQLINNLVVFSTEDANYPSGADTVLRINIQVETEGPQFTDADLFITVTPVNEAPEFSIVPAAISVDENSRETLTPASFMIVDEELDTAIHYILNTDISASPYVLEVAGNPTIALGQNDIFTQQDLMDGKVTINAIDLDLQNDFKETLVFSAVMSDGPASNSAVLDVTINAVNDTPTLDVAGFTMIEGDTKALSTTEIQFFDEETPNNATYTISGVGDMGGAEIVVDGVSIGTNGNFTQQQLIDNEVILSTTDANYPDGPDSTIIFNVQALSDGQATSVEQLIINVEPVNEAPSFTIIPSQLTIDEDTNHTLSAATFLLTDEESDTPQRYLVVSDLTDSPFTLEVDGALLPLNQGDTFSHSDLVAGNVSLNTSSFDSETPFAQKLIFVAQMDNGPSSGQAVLSLNLEPVNDAPTLSPILINVDENDTQPITATALGYEDEEGDLATHYVIDTLPTDANIILTLNGTPVTVGQSIPASDISDGNLLIDASNAAVSENSLSSISLHAVSADGQLSNSDTLFIQLIPQNDSSVLTAQPHPLIVNEGQNVELMSSTFTYTDEENADILEYVIQSLPNEMGVSVESNGVSLSVGDTFTQQQLDTGLVTVNAENAPVLTDSTGILSVYANTNDGTQSSTANLIIDFVKVEDAPSLSIAPFLAIQEGETVVLDNNQFTFTDEDGDTLIEYRLDSLLSSNGFEIQRNGLTLGIGDTFSSNDLAQGLISITSNGANIPTAMADQFSVTAVSSNGEQSNSAVAFVPVEPADDTPVLSVPFPIDAFENTITPLSPDSLVVSDQDGDPVSFYTVTSSLPTDIGHLLINGQAASAGDTFSQQALDSGNVSIDLTSLDITQDQSSEFEMSVNTGSESSAVIVVPVQLIAMNDSPVLTAPISAPTLALGESFQIPQNAFTDSDGDTISYSAVVSGDNTEPLPDWLTFDPTTQSFILNDNPGQELLVIKLIASDENNAQTSTLVNLQFEPIVAAALPEPEPALEPEPIEVLAKVVMQPAQDHALPEPEPVAPVIQTPPLAPEPELQIEPEAIEESEQRINDNEIFATNVETSRVDLASLLPALNRVDDAASTTATAANVQENSLAQLLGLTNDFDAVDPFSLRSYESTSFERDLDDLAARWDRQENVLEESYLNFDATVGSSVGLSSGFTVGYMIWLLRGGTLMSSVLTSLPAWRMIDPLPVLAEVGDGDDADNESLESMVSRADQVAEANDPTPPENRV